MKFNIKLSNQHVMKFNIKLLISHVELVQLTDAVCLLHPLFLCRTPRSLAPPVRPWTGHQHHCPFLQFLVVLVLFLFLNVVFMQFEVKELTHSLPLRRAPLLLAAWPLADRLRLH